MKTLNIRAEFTRLAGLDGRTPSTEGDALDKCFGAIVPYRDSLVTTVKFSGKSAWEKHADDEILFVVDGHGFITEIDEHGYPNPQSLSPGIIAIVAAGRWHQVDSEKGISLLTVSPQPTEHLPVASNGAGGPVQ